MVLFPLIDFYKKITGVYPSTEMIDMLNQTNDLNNINIDKNHACSILKLTMVREQELGLQEEHRFWSIVDVYNTVPTEQLYDTVLSFININNYGILLKN